LDNQQLLEEMARVSRLAGAAILEVYERADFDVQTKDDNSPLTAADLAAHQIIVDELSRIAPDIPILSEESDSIDFETRSSWKRYFLVDPLDGTKEFVSRNGEFTVNIALIEGHLPMLGAVYVPVQDKMYLGDVARNQATRISAGETSAIRVRSIENNRLTVVASRRHGSDALVSLMAKLSESYEVETENVGSSLKFCLIAEGKADLYPRFAPTSEWDTGAAQAVVAAAGGHVVNLQFEALDYNAKADILNPHFIVFADTDVDWQALVDQRT
jgi:3'(2'), 5'-bisphosphate nucleotidase